MKLQQLLNYINNYFEKLGTFQKIEMYLIPIIIALLLIYNYPLLQKKMITDMQNINQDVYSYEIKKQKLLKKINSVHNIKVVKDIQNYAKELNLKITALKVIEKNISLEVQGKLKSIMNFLYFTENYNDFTKVENFMMTKLDNTNEVKVFLNLSFGKIIRTKSNEELVNKINNINNPFVRKTQNPKPKLYAIVNDHVLINNKWLKQNDSFDGFVVFKIHLDFVELESNGNVFKIGLFSDK